MDENAHPSFDFCKNGISLGRVTLRVPGILNVYNAVAAMALADLLDIPVETMEKGLEAFGGTDRRFQKKGAIGGVTIVDDYAHHPTEIRRYPDSSPEHAT